VCCSVLARGALVPVLFALPSSTLPQHHLPFPLAARPVRGYAPEDPRLSHHPYESKPRERAGNIAAAAARLTGTTAQRWLAGRLIRTFRFSPVPPDIPSQCVI
jgi:hypothetical protein